MRIAYINPGGSIGGAEMCLLDVLASLRTLRPEAEPFVVLGAEGPLCREIENLGIPCDVLPLPEGIARLGDAGAKGVMSKLSLALRGATAAASTLNYARHLARYLRTKRPDIIQTNGMKMHLLGAWTAPKGVPVVWHLHDYLGPRAAMARLLRVSAKQGIEVVAVSKSVAEDARTSLGSRIPIHVIYNAVDVDRFSPGPGDGAALDRASGWNDAVPGTLRIGLLATFATWKGHEVFLEAICQLTSLQPLRFFIVGGPIYQSSGSQVSMEDLKSRAETLGLTDRVGFTGHLDDPAEALRSLDIVIHASTRPEPFGRVIVEGMGCGRAVVAMSEGGAAELFQDGQDALGCVPRDPLSLAQAMTRLIDDSDLRGRLGRAARQTVLRRFDRSRLSADWTPIYDRITQSPTLIPVPARPVAH